VTTTHLCILCPQRHRGEPEHYERANACQPCRVWLDGLLRDVGDLWARLPEALPPVSGHGPRVSGSREAPIPLRVDVLDLGLRTRKGSRGPFVRGVLGLDDDQTGHLSAGTILDTITGAWIGETWCRATRLPVPTVPALAQWLRRWADDACDRHTAIDEDAADLRELRSTLRSVLGDRSQRPEHMSAPCPGCDLLTLVRRPGEDLVECADDDCRRVLTGDEYASWSGLVIAAQRGVLAQ
jgi:hypothetical protein